MYKAKYAFEGQDGEISLQKDDVVELLQKDDNGWWLVSKDGEEGWAPYNYLELVPPKAASVAIPPPPPRTRPMTTPNVTPIAVATVDASSKPAPVFPGMGSAANGSATPWQKSPAPTQPGWGSVETMKASMKTGGKVPPPAAMKPKPPPVSAKPVKPSIGGAKPGSGKPPVPAAVKPPPVASNKPGTIARPAMVGGQLDLAAAVSLFFQEKIVSPY